ncbi:MAG: VWA domain-containing protein [Chthoniobacterales bacterium]
MSVDILRPWALLFLLFLPLVWWLARYSAVPLGRRRKFISLCLRMLILSLLMLALSEPRWISSTQKEQIIIMVDLSRSTRASALAAAKEFAEKTDFGDAEVLWMGFAGKSTFEDGLEELEKVPPKSLLDNQTALNEALGVAAASFRDDRVKTLILFSDGNSTDGKPETAGLAARDIQLNAIPTSPPEDDEVLVRSVRAPASARKNEPVRISGEIRSNVTGPTEVNLFRNGVRVATRKIELKKGMNSVEFDDRAGEEKLLFYELGIRSEKDTIAENNLTGTVVLSSGSSRALFLTDQPESARYLQWALEQEDIILDVRPGVGAPITMEDLQNYEVVFMDNVPASSLSRDQMLLMKNYVRDFGGGFVMLGGDEAFGLGGYYRTPIEDILPVKCDFEKEEENPSLALSLVIDRSGSMLGDKIELAKSAAIAAAKLLSPKDFISVIVFDGRAHSVVGITPALNLASVKSQIASITAGGGTNIAPAMEESLRELVSVSAKLKHVILLTDGVSTPGPFYELATEMTRNQITVSTVAVGGGADADLLAQIAQWGNGRFYETADPQTIPQIFTKETMTASKSAIQEFPFLASPVRLADFLEGVNWKSAPFLLGYVRTRAKPTSETWLQTERGDPLLSTWRFGLGTTAAFTSDARNRWAVEWLRWPGFGKFWAQLLRKLQRPNSLGLTDYEIKDSGDKVELTVNALNKAGEFPRDAEAILHLSDPSGKVRAISMKRYAPGQWKQEFAADTPGVYSGQVRILQNGETVDTKLITYTRNFSREFLLEQPDTETLRVITKKTGGRMDADLTLAENRERKAPSELELWPWLVLIAIFLFLLDVANRRLPDDHFLNSTIRKPNGHQTV